MDKRKRRIVGATAVSAAAMASMLGIAAPAQAEAVASSASGPPAAQGALLKVENAMLKLEGAFLKAPAVDNAFLKVQSIFLKFNGSPT